MNYCSLCQREVTLEQQRYCALCAEQVQKKSKVSTAFWIALMIAFSLICVMLAKGL